MRTLPDPTLNTANERLSIPALWKMLPLRGRPGKSCRWPFRENRNASFSVFAEGRRWRHRAACQSGNAVNFLALALHISSEAACRKLIEPTGTHRAPDEHHPNPAKPSRPPVSSDEKKECKRQSWPIFDRLKEAEIKAIAELHGLSVEGVCLAASRGLLWCADSREGRAWIVTDSYRRNSQARRLDVKLWECIASKAWTLPVSPAAWPIEEFLRLIDDHIIDGKPIVPGSMWGKPQLPILEILEYRRNHLSNRPQKAIANLLKQRIQGKVESSRDISQPLEGLWVQKYGYFIVDAPNPHAMAILQESG